jgi:tRNA(Ser,Leu) C12 N-acetylase TAN1
MKTFEEFTKQIPIELDSSKDNKNLKAEIDKKISEKMKKQQIKKIRKIQKSMNKYLNGDSSF